MKRYAFYSSTLSKTCRKDTKKNLYTKIFLKKNHILLNKFIQKQKKRTFFLLLCIFLNIVHLLPHCEDIGKSYLNLVITAYTKSNTKLIIYIILFSN